MKRDILGDLYVWLKYIKARESKQLDWRSDQIIENQRYHTKDTGLYLLDSRQRKPLRFLIRGVMCLYLNFICMINLDEF